TRMSRTFFVVLTNLAKYSCTLKCAAGIIKRKTNEEILGIVKEKHKIVEDAPRHPEKLHNIIIEVKRTAGLPRNSYIEQIKNNAKTKTFTKGTKGSNRLKLRIKAS
ncbi:Uncharacterized protein FWK35_00005258, partial [Aphis craccivora]